MTDSASVSNVLNEITAKIAELATAGRSLRLNFKVGSLIVQNSKFCWQHSKEIIGLGRTNQSMDRASMGGETSIAKVDRLTVM